MRNLWVILTIFTICMQHQFPYNNASTIRLTNFICQSHNESWISVHVCRLKAINRNKIVLNFNATMHNTCYELSTTLQLYKKANGYKPWLYNSSVDICKFTRKPYNPFAIMIYKVMRQYSNMNHTCPYGRHVLRLQMLSNCCGGNGSPEYINIAEKRGTEQQLFGSFVIVSKASATDTSTAGYGYVFSLRYLRVAVALET
ncbi:uncharacterized protein Dmoj_GI24475 [Drosophila mojavensis]|uniref:Uncharacterized protein n=1 Tax=Drosophila mojavensis TaxID=7230 RepID=B4KD58_DROMO|nr:uncharacterized protein Dmoj_GI24475 [Drosophila mojavensis]